MDTNFEKAERYYQQRYYTYQTVARGLLTVQDLTVKFESLSRYYWNSLRRHMPSDKSKLVLDLPCGYGNFLYFLRKHGYANSKGYDLDPLQVALARTLDLDAQVENAFKVLEILSESPSMIVSIDFIEHLDKSSALRFLEKCFERLPPGGRLIIRTPCADGPFGAHDLCNDITHEWGLTSNALSCILSMVGFSSVSILDVPHVSPSGGPLQACRWLVCKLSRAVVGTIFKAMCIGPPRVWERSMWAVAQK